MTAAPVLQARGVRKSFPGVVALRGVDFEVAKGEVRGLVGENGAGKSTLVKIMTGALPADRGTVEIGGRTLHRSSPALAGELGLTALHQERFIAPDISVAENILMGQLPRRLGSVDWRTAYRRAKESLDQLGLDLDPRMQAGSLGVGEQQQVELARALSRNAQIIVMDEPTASLSGQEVVRLFEIIRQLQRAGSTVVYISHHLEELFQIATSVTVMRDGAVVGTYGVAELDIDRLLSLMFGGPVRRERAQTDGSRGGQEASAANVALEARDLHVPPLLRGASLELRRGEIVGLTGGMTSGRRELARCLAGILPMQRGRITISDTSRRARIAFVPDDRKREGIIPDLGVVDNVEVTRVAVGRNPLVSRLRQLRRVARWISELQIRAANVRAPVRQLSGGNQQKVILARWLNARSTIFVLDEPTAGVDVNTKIELYAHLRRLAADGAAIAVFSSDYEELRLVANRVLVLRRGVVAAELQPEEISEEALFAIEMA